MHRSHSQITTQPYHTLIKNQKYLNYKDYSFSFIFPWCMNITNVRRKKKKKKKIRRRSFYTRVKMKRIEKRKSKMYTSAPSLQSSLTSPQSGPIFQTILPLLCFQPSSPPFPSFLLLHHPPTLFYTPFCFSKNHLICLSRPHTQSTTTNIYTFSFVEWLSHKTPSLFFSLDHSPSLVYHIFLSLSLIQKEELL